jgi:hypothetical protein
MLIFILKRNIILHKRLLFIGSNKEHVNLNITLSPDLSTHATSAEQDNRLQGRVQTVHI